MYMKAVSRFSASLLLVAIIGLQAACASQPTPTPTPAPTKAPVSTPAPQKAPEKAATTPAATKAPDKAATPAAKAPATPYTLNYISSLTGQGAFIGQSQKIGLETFQKYINARGGINGQPLEIAVTDDQSNPRVAVQLANDLIAKKVNLIMGPLLAAGGAAVIPLVTNGPVLYLTGSGINPDPNSYVFTALPANFDQYRTLLNFFKTKGWTKIALFVTSDAQGQSISESFQQALKMPDYSSITMVTEEQADATATSMSAQAIKIKNSGADVAVLAAVGAPATTMFKAAMQAGLTIPVATSNGNLTYASMTANKDVLPAELYFTGTHIDAYDILPPGPAKDIQTQFRQGLAAVNIKPDIPTAPTFDTAGIIVEALKKVGTNATPAQLREALESIKGYEGVLGTYNLSKTDHRGLTMNTSYVVRWDQGKGTWVVMSGPAGLPAKN